MTIPVRYWCDACGLKDITVKVRCRRHGEPVADWMHAMAIELAFDHRQRSPTCHPQEFTQVMVPMTGREHVGGPTVQ